MFTAPPIFTRLVRLFDFGKRKRPIRRTSLQIEQLESRDCPTAAPVIGSVVFDHANPKTADILVAQALNATDADNDTILFQFEWSVNGNPVQTSFGINPYASLNLATSGLGDKGDSISVSVTPFDANDFGTPTTIYSTVVNSAPAISNWNLSDVQSFIGDAVALQITASDADGDSFTFSATGLPTGLSINSTTGEITGTVSTSASTTTPYSVTITANDGTTNGTQMFDWTINTPTAEVLYDRYLGAVSNANATYLVAVAGRDASLNTARSDAQSVADELYADYLAAISDAEVTYDSALTDAQADYDSAIESADAAWTSATASARASYDAAIASAQDTFDAALVSLQAEYEDAIAIADAAFEDAIAPYLAAQDAAYTAWQNDLENSGLEAAYDAATAALASATSTAESTRQDAYLAADEAGQAGADSAQIAYDEAADDAESTYQAAIATPNEDWTTTKTSAESDFTSANDAVEYTLLANEDSAWSIYTDGVDSLDATLAITESEINDGNETTVSIASSAWASSEASAWGIYATAMAELPGTPPLGDRNGGPPTVPFDGISLGDRPTVTLVSLTGQDQPPAQRPLIDWTRARAATYHEQSNFGAGHFYSVPIRGGGTISVWRPEDSVQQEQRRYWCHGFTFGGTSASGGPFSVYGDDVWTLLSRGYNRIQPAQAAPNDIVVWTQGQELTPEQQVAAALTGNLEILVAASNSVVHSAVLTEVRLNNTNFDPANTLLDTKNASNPFQKDMPLQTICNGDGAAFDGYGGYYRVYRAR